MNKFISFCTSILIVLMLWYIGSLFFDPLFLPTPLKVFTTLFSMIVDGTIIEALGLSFFRITIATTLSILISILLGILIVCSETANEFLSPIVSFMRYLPVTAFYPLLIMWVGIGESMRITFVFCATVFFFLPTVILALREVNKEQMDSAQALGLSKIQAVTHVIFPIALPSICESFLMMYGIGWTYIIIAEIVNTNNGLGHIINIASARGRTDMVFVALLVIILFSVIFDTLGKKMIHKKFSWKYH
jgi:NitT/TauT family transport system permease protein